MEFGKHESSIESVRMHATAARSAGGRRAGVHLTRLRTPVLLRARRRCTNDLSYRSDYARGGGGSGGKLRDGGATTINAIVREGVAKGAGYALTSAAARATTHGPIAWHMGRLIRWSHGISPGICSGISAAAGPVTLW